MEPQRLGVRDSLLVDQVAGVDLAGQVVTVAALRLAVTAGRSAAKVAGRMVGAAAAGTSWLASLTSNSRTVRGCTTSAVAAMVPVRSRALQIQIRA
ncbi:hypothetical protein FB475_2883 [Kribbella jejuensis]|uniref:Uncharacterized protein n=1 Tax=Kribbella jejuensis TaxID=236068 RepID=A0A542EU87_9ACTN|nr:hypothetical protein FB475_2883 [Kribbella jejuensis]